MQAMHLLSYRMHILLSKFPKMVIFYRCEYFSSFTNLSCFSTLKKCILSSAPSKKRQGCLADRVLDMHSLLSHHTIIILVPRTWSQALLSATPISCHATVAAHSTSKISNEGFSHCDYFRFWEFLTTKNFRYKFFLIPRPLCPLCPVYAASYHEQSHVLTWARQVLRSQLDSLCNVRTFTRPYKWEHESWAQR